MANPPYGRLSTTANPTAIAPRGWSVNKPRTGEPFSITSISGAANTCTVETSAAHNYIDGDPVTVQGTGLNCDTADSVISTANRTASDATVTVVTTAPHTLVVGARFFLEGTQCKTLAGSYTVGAINSPTEFEFESFDTTALSLTPTGCNIAYSLPVTVTGATTFTYAKTGASGSAATGTVASSRVIPPLQQDDPFTENSLFDAPVHVLTYSPWAQTTGLWSGCNGNRINQFHSTDAVWDASGQFINLRCDTSGPLIFRVTWSGGSPNNPSLTLVRNMNIGGSGSCKWDRVVGDRMWCIRNGNDLVRYDNVSAGSGNTGGTTVFDFGSLTPACTSASIAGPSGGGDEGPGTTIGGRIAIRCVESSPTRRGVVVFNTNTETVESRYRTQAGSDVDFDYIHVIDTAGGPLIGVGVRWGASATLGDNFDGTLSVSGGVGTLTKSGASFGYLSSGLMVRLMGCSNNAYNTLWTATSGSGTTATLNMAGAPDGSATGCQMAVQDRGMNYFKDNAGTLEIDNAFRWVGSHGMFGLDAAGHPVWVGSAQLSGNLCPGGSGGNGTASWHVDSATWTEEAAWPTQTAAVGVCHNILPVGGGGTDNNVSISAVGWFSGSPRATGETSGAVGALDPITNANWFNTPAPWNSAEHVIYVSKLVEPGASLERYDLAHLYMAEQLVSGFVFVPYPNISLDGRYIVWNCTWRFDTADAPGVCLTDLTAWADSDTPTLTSISPDEGTQGTTVTDVTLTGTNFDGGNAVVNISGTGVTATNCDPPTATEIVCDFEVDLTATPVGPRNVTVTTDLGTSGPQVFTVNAAVSAPTLTSLSPTSGWRGAQYTVVFTGTGLDGANPALASSCSDVTFPSFVVDGATQITAQVVVGPGQGGAACNFSVSTDDGTSELRTFTVNAPTNPNSFAYPFF